VGVGNYSDPPVVRLEPFLGLAYAYDGAVRSGPAAGLDLAIVPDQNDLPAFGGRIGLDFAIFGSTALIVPNASLILAFY